MTIEIKSTTKVANGQLIRLSHSSVETGTTMTLAVFLPNSVDRNNNTASLSYLVYLSGLTCTDENVCQKSGVFKRLAHHNMAFVAPDTSPRGANVPGEDDGWDFGTGAGFYLDASSSTPYGKNYRMYSYVTKELPALLQQEFPCLDGNRVGITGHSMGGHGALTIALKNQSAYKSVSAFAPISHPSACPWGLKAFNGYLGEDQSQWEEYDATLLMKKFGKSTFDDILVDVGTGDNFYKQGQLLPEDFATAAKEVGQSVTLRLHDGYDHSYFFVSTFIDEHVDFHAARLL